jgi:hypothetical protein
LWKGIRPARLLLAVENDTPFKSILLDVEMNTPCTSILGCALVFAWEANIEIEAKNSFRLEERKRHDFACFVSKQNSKNLKRKRIGNNRNEAKKSKQKEKEPKIT